MNFTALFFAGFAALTQAQTPPPRDAGAPAAVPAGTGGISGVVIDEQAQPLRRVAVTLAGDMRVNLSTLTGDDGRFAFANLPAGRFTIKADKPGYPSTSYGATRPGRPGAGIFLTADQQVTGISFKVARGGVLAGTVYDDRGLPRPGVALMAWVVRTTLTGERTVDEPITGGEWVTTDDQGRYRIYGLPPAEYTVGTYWGFGAGQLAARVPTDAEISAAFAAAAQPSRPGQFTAPLPPLPAPPKTFAYSPVYYPGTTDPNTASTVTLTPGEERTGLDIRMQFAPMTRVESTVVGPDGPVAGARMEFHHKVRGAGGGVTSVSSSGPDGRYTTSSVAAGDYRLVARTRKTDTSPAMYAVAELSVSGAEPVPVTLQLQPGMRMSGRIAFEGTTLPPPPDLTKVTVNLFPTSNGGAPTPEEPTVMDATGSFTLTGIMPGSFRVNAQVPNPAGPNAPRWVLKSVVNGGQDITDLPLEFRPGDAPSLVVTFTDQIAELSGTITDAAGKPAPDYFIIVTPADQRMFLVLSRRILSTRPDAQGRFVFRNLPPGDYRISATTDLVQRDLQDFSTLAVLAGQSTPVTIGLGEKKVFDLKIGGQ
jgi:hypothetical protein